MGERAILRGLSWRRALVLLGAALLAWLAILTAQIISAGRSHATGSADAAIVLGAAVHGDQPSPVFRERIRHGVHLYRTGRVRRLIFTGGYDEKTRLAESTAAHAYAIQRGMPPSAILIETHSRTTQQNTAEAAKLLRENKLRTALVVSDPLHLKRALTMAHDQGIDASGAPTPTTMYRGWSSRAGFLLRELYFYNHYLVTGH
ncbi:YdcF family protein [Sphingomonas koreensis]